MKTINREKLFKYIKFTSQGLTEYILILALVSVVVIGVLSAMGSNTRSLYSNRINTYTTSVDLATKCSNNPSLCGTAPPGGGTGAAK